MGSKVFYGSKGSKVILAGEVQILVSKLRHSLYHIERGRVKSATQTDRKMTKIKYRSQEFANTSTPLIIHVELVSVHK